MAQEQAGQGRRDSDYFHSIDLPPQYRILDGEGIGSKSGKKKTQTVLPLPLLRARGGLLLGLPLRVSNLPELPERKCLGLDLQRHHLDLSRLRTGQVFLIVFFLDSDNQEKQP